MLVAPGPPLEHGGRMASEGAAGGVGGAGCGARRTPPGDDGWRTRDVYEDRVTASSSGGGASLGFLIALLPL